MWNDEQKVGTGSIEYMLYTTQAENGGVFWLCLLYRMDESHDDLHFAFKFSENR